MPHMRVVIKSATTFTKVMVVIWAIVSTAGAAAAAMLGGLGSALRTESLVTVFVSSAIGFVWLSIAFLYWPLTRLKPAAWVIWLATNGAALPLAYALSQARSSAATSLGVAVTVLIGVNLLLYAMFGFGWRLVKARRRSANPQLVAT